MYMYLYSCSGCNCISVAERLCKALSNLGAVEWPAFHVAFGLLLGPVPNTA